MWKSHAFWTAVLFLLALGAQVSGIVSQPVATACFVAAALMLIYALFDAYRHQIKPETPAEYVTLKDAAGVVFHGIRDTMIGGFCQTIGKEEHLLNAIGAYIFEVVPVYGKFKVSTVREELPRDILKTHGIVGGSKRVRPHGSQETIYSELEIKRDDVHNAISLLREMSTEHDNKATG